MIDHAFGMFHEQRDTAHKRASHGLAGMLLAGVVELGAAIVGYRIARSQTDSDLLGVVGGLIAAKTASEVLCELSCRFALVEKKPEVGPSTAPIAAPTMATAPAAAPAAQDSQGPLAVVRGGRSEASGTGVSGAIVRGNR
jgi:hypothetical protein